MRYRGITLVIICAIGLGILLHGAFDRPIRYEIPGGYKGWMIVQFENGGCPLLPRQGVFRVVSVPSSGRVCTSDHHPDHLTYYKFEYVFPDGRRESLRWNYHGKPGTQVWSIGYAMEDRSDELFVGDEEAMNHSGPPPPTNAKARTL
jgi:hypothetical protein